MSARYERNHLSLSEALSRERGNMRAKILLRLRDPWVVSDSSINATATEGNLGASASMILSGLKRGENTLYAYHCSMADAAAKAMRSDTEERMSTHKGRKSQWYSLVAYRFIANLKWVIVLKAPSPTFCSSSN